MIMETVIFYKEKEGGILAVFPYMNHTIGLATCYSHDGQHSTTAFEYCNALRKASKSEYASLKAELEEIGYKLRVI